jgi:hypothetical protein
MTLYLYQPSLKAFKILERSIQGETISHSKTTGAPRSLPSSCFLSLRSAQDVSIAPVSQCAFQASHLGLEVANFQLPMNWSKYDDVP